MMKLQGKKEYKVCAWCLTYVRCLVFGCGTHHSTPVLLIQHLPLLMLLPFLILFFLLITTTTYYSCLMTEG